MNVTRKIILISLMLLLSVSLFAANGQTPPAGGSETGGSALPEWIWRDFDQRVVNVSFIVNDILYAGFSKKAVTQFLPVQDATRLSAQEPVSEEDADSYHSTMFFIYCLASTKMGVQLSLDFSSEYKGTNPTDNIGLMISDSKEPMDPKDKKIPVTLEGATKLPFVLDVLHASDKVQTVAVSNDAENALRLTVKKSDIPAKASGTYHTELVLTAVIQ